MKLFKQADLYINCVLLVILGFLVLMNQLLITKAYFIIGGWQVFSMIIHILNGWFMKKGGARAVYHRTVAIILLMVLISQLWYPFLFIFFFLLIGSPVLAIIYTMICYDELKELEKQRTLSLTK